MEESVRQTDSLAKTLREDAEQSPAGGAEIAEFDHRFDAGAQGGTTQPLEPPAETEVLPDAQFRGDRHRLGEVAHAPADFIRLRAHIEPGDAGRSDAGVRRQERGQDAHGGRLPRAVLAEESGDLAARDGEGDAVEDGSRTERSVQVRHLDHGPPLRTTPKTGPRPAGEPGSSTTEATLLSSGPEKSRERRGKNAGVAELGGSKFRKDRGSSRRGAPATRGFPPPPGTS